MAQVTGMICDICEKFAVVKIGWMRLTTDADKDNKGFDICSNACLKRLANNRINAAKENGTHTVRTLSEKEMETRQNAPKQDPARPKPADYSEEQKLAIVEEVLESSVYAVANKYGLPWQAVARWKGEYS